MDLIHRISRRIRKGLYSPKVNCSPCEHFIELGSRYGNWPALPLKTLFNSKVICAGAGEDISFDIELASMFNLTVIAVDPTPRAIEHCTKVMARVGQQRRSEYSQSGNQPIDAYDLSGISKEQFQLVEKALWNKEEKLKFYAPRIASHVSHSVVNYQNNYRTDTSHIEVDATLVSKLIDDHLDGNQEPELIKLDIEGAETVVIPEMLKNGIKPKQLLVEFDELCEPSPKARQNFYDCNQLILDAGYVMAFHDGHANFAYVTKSIYENLEHLIHRKSD